MVLKRVIAVPEAKKAANINTPDRFAKSGRLFAFKSESEIKVGDSLYCASSKTAKARGSRYKGSGLVVNSVKFNSLFYCLATLDVDLIESKITLNNEHGPTLKKINNE